MLVRYQEGQQRSGRLGATIASHNAAGAYLRAGTIPVNPNTARQVQMRGIVRNLTIAWQNLLTQAQRDGWETYAKNVDWKNKLGDTIHLTGLNHFVRSNSIRNRTPGGTAQVDDAPTIFNLFYSEEALAVVGSEATQQITVSFNDLLPWATRAGAAQWFFMGIPKNAGVHFFNGPYRWCGAAFGSDPAVSPVVITAPFPIADGNRLWVRSRTGDDDGRLSEFAEVNFLCGP